jgi:hypothetical protein
MHTFVMHPLLSVIFATPPHCATRGNVSPDGGTAWTAARRGTYAASRKGRRFRQSGERLEGGRAQRRREKASPDRSGALFSDPGWLACLGFAPRRRERAACAAGARRHRSPQRASKDRCRGEKKPQHRQGFWSANRLGGGGAPSFALTNLLDSQSLHKVRGNAFTNYDHFSGVRDRRNRRAIEMARW